MERDLLLISNSKLYGSGYLDHCESQIVEILGDRKEVLFVPFARPGGMTFDQYTHTARERFKRMGFNLRGIHESNNSYMEIQRAEAIFIGGGNTFLLLDQLYVRDLIADIFDKVLEGTPFIGSSAGSNVAGSTIMTTNDMPIAYPRSFDALGLVPFNINPHYLDPSPDSKHMGETREARIKEYHVFNDTTVVGLREGAMLRVRDNKVSLIGNAGARVFRKGQEPTEHLPGESLDFLLEDSK